MSRFAHRDFRGNSYAVDVKRMIIPFISYSLSSKSEYDGFVELMEQLIWHPLELSTKRYLNKVFYFLTIESLEIIYKMRTPITTNT